MSKLDTRVDLQWGMQTSKQNFQARQVGAVEAAMFITGWSGNRSSRGTVFISLVFPGRDERRQLKGNLDRILANATNIFTPTHVEKYLARYQQLQQLTLIEYFTAYRVTATQDKQDDFPEPGEEVFGERVRVIDQNEETFFSEPLLPRECTDGFYTRYKARTTNKLPLWRTYLYQQTEGEAFYYQQIFLNMPFKDKAE